MTLLSDCCVYSFHTYHANFRKGLPCTLGNLVNAAQAPVTVKPESYDRQKPRPAARWVPARIERTLTGKYLDVPIWKLDPRALGRDYYTPLQRLVSGKQPDRCRTYGLTDDGKRLFKDASLYEAGTPATERYRHRLALRFTSAALERLKRALPAGISIPDRLLRDKDAKGREEAVKGPDEAEKEFFLPIRLSDVFVYHFATDRLICQLRLEPEKMEDFPMTSALLAEIVDSVGRFPKLAWCELPPPILKLGDSPTLLEKPEFSLGSLVARLLFGADGQIETPFRTFTHTYAQVTPDGAETDHQSLRQLGARLARQYNSDYALSEKASGIHMVSDFDNLVHVMSREGAATVIDPRTEGAGVEFLDEYRHKALEPAYLPLVALNLHQHDRGLELGARAVLATPDHGHLAGKEYGDRIEDEGVYQSMIRGWTNLQDDLARLNMNFRFRQVSAVSMHNAFNQALRQSLDLEGLEAQLSADFTDMSARMQTAILMRNQLRQQDFERRYSWLPMAAAAFAAAALASGLIGAYNSAPEDSPALYWGEGLFFLVSIVSGFGWAYFVTKTKPRNNPRHQHKPGDGP